MSNIDSSETRTCYSKIVKRRFHFPSLLNASLCLEAEINIELPLQEERERKRNGEKKRYQERAGKNEKERVNMREGKINGERDKRRIVKRNK